MKKIIAVLAATLLAFGFSASPVYAANIGGSGTFKIGSKYKAGIYVSSNSNTAGCYWARLSGFGGSLDEIISSEFGSGQMIVQIESSDKGFKSSRCGTWKPVGTFKALSSIKTNGIFQVGSQLKPGTYSSNGTGSCYWARLSGFSGTMDDILASDFASGPQVVTIEDGDVGFKTSRCGTWSKID